MKKIYQTPEIDVLPLATKKCFLGELSGDGDPLANQDKTFQESEIATEVHESGTVSLWDD